MSMTYLSVVFVDVKGKTLPDKSQLQSVKHNLPVEIMVFFSISYVLLQIVNIWFQVLNFIDILELLPHLLVLCSTYILRTNDINLLKMGKCMAWIHYDLMIEAQQNKVQKPNLHDLWDILYHWMSLWTRHTGKRILICPGNTEWLGDKWDSGAIARKIPSITIQPLNPCPMGQLLSSSRNNVGIYCVSNVPLYQWVTTDAIVMYNRYTSCQHVWAKYTDTER